MAEQLSVQGIELTPEDFYRACLQDCSVFQSFESSTEWLKQHLAPRELPEFNQKTIWQAEKLFRKRAESYSISQVPTIIIRERFALDANSAKSLPRMMAILQHLLKKTQ